MLRCCQHYQQKLGFNFEVASRNRSLLLLICDDIWCLVFMIGLYVYFSTKRSDLIGRLEPTHVWREKGIEQCYWSNTAVELWFASAALLAYLWWSGLEGVWLTTTEYFLHVSISVGDSLTEQKSWMIALLDSFAQVRSSVCERLRKDI